MRPERFIYPLSAGGLSVLIPTGKIFLTLNGMKAMILAAGRGERMRPLTDRAPKPLLTVGDRTLIEHHLEALRAGGIREVVINLAWLGAQIREKLGNGDAYGLEITYSEEEAGALETGGGIFQALPMLGQAPFWLVNGDVYCDFNYDHRTLEPHSLGHLVMVANPTHHPAGDFALRDGILAPRDQDALTYSGIAMLDPALFAGCRPGKFPLAPLLNAAIEKQALTGERFDGLWADVGTPERLAELDSVITKSS